MSTYNIHPLALSKRHYILAKQSGIFLPPLELIPEYGGRFELAAELHGAHWLARIDAGHFALEADLAASGTFLGRYLDAGHFGMEADLTTTGIYREFSRDAGRFELKAELKGDVAAPIYFDAGHFELEADLAASGTFLGRYLDAGHFGMEADLSGSPALILTAGRFALEADLQATPLRAYPAGRFALEADLQMTGMYRGFLRDAGHFALEADLSGTFHRDVWWADVQPVTAQRIYTCTLTGAADGVDDAVLPMSSFQFRLYDHGGSYLSVVVPNAVLYAPEISARLNGQIVIRQGYRYGDGSVNASEMARAGQITMRHDTGARNSSATITAGESITFSFDPGVTKRVTKLINRTLQADGNWQFRTVPIFGLFPGDSVNIDGTAWNVNRVSVAVGRNMQTMEILSDGPS